MDSNDHPIDVFISYEHTSKPIADALVSSLEEHMIRCWYAPRNVRGGYAASIMNAISTCRVFVILLCKESSESPQVLNEVEAAYARVMTGGLPIIPVRLDSKDLSAEMQYYIKRLHWVDATDNSLDETALQLLQQVFEYLPDRKCAFEKAHAQNTDDAQQSKARTKNQYFEAYGDAASEEDYWLSLQNLILKEHDDPIYDRLLQDAKDIAVLDVGCGDAGVLIDRVGSREQVSSVLGIDVNTLLIRKAIDSCRDDSRYTFIECDCESTQLAEMLLAYLQEKGLTGFDFVNITMTILHLQKPYVLLRTLRRFINKGGAIFIRGIDDGMNIAYPDEHGWFRKLNDLCFALPTTGCRTSGRQIFAMLKRAGFTDIRLEKAGVSTVGMTHDQRYALF